MRRTKRVPAGTNAVTGAAPRSDRPTDLSVRHGWRSAFKKKVTAHLSGALTEFYKARLATKNGQTKWVEHWMNEVKRLINLELSEALTEPIRGFTDRRKAFDEAVADIKKDDVSFRHYAETTVKKDYRLTKVRIPLNANDTDDFWTLVDDVVVPALR
jgi:hypothetical protein